MENYFENEIKLIESELTNLKQSKIRSAGAIAISKQNVAVSADLQYEDSGGAYGSAYAIKVYEIATSSPAIIMPTLSWYSSDIEKPAILTEYSARKIDIYQAILDNGNCAVVLYFNGTNDSSTSDAAKVQAGETVTISVELTVACTENFTITENTIW